MFFKMMVIMMCLSCFQGCGSSSSIEAHLELGQETQRQDLETEGQSNKRWIFLYSLVSKLKSAANHLKSILTKIFLSRPINNNQTPIYPDAIEAKTVLILGFTALLGLLGVSYRINGHGNIVPTALFHKPTNTFTFFLIIIMMIIYFAAIGMMLAKACPKIAKVLNVISFVCLLLGVTVLLWTLCPRSINWIPWTFFACTFVAAFGVTVYWRFTETSSTLSSTVSLGYSYHAPIQV
eukprot:TRINITY_DN9299_c1_g1_i1.p1 TRINITY_DN9299_c1_g1~~TRINITY_DN9299_c1_g1_i1.p1  ORF type:complete len:236 (-),score=17.10 TRINITY_DN9299_c1_g1_i1:295-1002(-)